MNRLRWSWISGVALLLVVVTSACGDEEPESTLQCGEHTTLHDGMCVAVEHDCDDTQIVTPAGQCQSPEIFCGDGSQYDASSGRCLPDSDVVCGPGTIEVSEECVVADAVQCGPGTVLANEVCVLSDEICGAGTELDDAHCHPAADVCSGQAQWDVEQGRCLRLDAVECGEGTTEYNNRCIPQQTMADELAAQADIAFGDGEPIVPTEAGPFIFTGALDTSLSQTFTLQGETAQWLKITVYPRGLPSPGFTVRDAFGDWARTVSPGLASAPSRVVFIPDDDDFELTINTSLSDSEHSDSFGDPSWEYVGTVEVIDRPSPVEWDNETQLFEGDLADTPQNLVSVDTSDTDLLLVSARNIGADIRRPTLERWSTPATFASRHELDSDEPIMLDTSTVSVVFFHIDAEKFVGPRTDFSLQARSTVSLDSGAFYDDTIEASAGEVLFISHRSQQAESVQTSVYREGQLLYTNEEVLAENRSSYGQHDSKYDFLYIEEDGEYLVEFQNTSSSTLDDFASTSRAATVPVFEMPAQGEHDFEAHVDADDLEPGDWRLMVIVAPDTAFFEVLITAGEGSPRGSVFDAQRNELQSVFGTGGTANMEFISQGPGIYYVVSRPWSSFSSVGGGLDFDITGEVVDSLDAGDTHQESFTVDIFDIIYGTITHRAGQAPDIRVLNPQGTVVFEAQEVSQNFDLMELVPGPGEFTVEVENTGQSPTLGLDVDLRDSTPLDVIDAEGDFSLDYDRSPLAGGDSEFVLVYPSDDMIVDVEAAYGAQESAALRVWNVAERELIATKTDSNGLQLQAQLPGVTPYIIEFQAHDDIENGYLWALNAVEITAVSAVREYDPYLTVATGGAQQTSTNSVSGCDEILDLSIAVDMPSGIGSQVDIDLFAPNQGGDSIALRDGSFGSHTTVYPDETSPDEPLDSLFGSSGNGVWSIDITNNSGSTTVELASWGIHLICAK